MWGRRAPGLGYCLEECYHRDVIHAPSNPGVTRSFVQRGIQRIDGCLLLGLHGTTQKRRL
jgi:hypothetical protein